MSRDGFNGEENYYPEPSNRGGSMTTTKITTNNILSTALNAAADVAEAQYGTEAGAAYRAEAERLRGAPSDAAIAEQGGVHDSDTCTADNGSPCVMCLWAREVGRNVRPSPDFALRDRKRNYIGTNGREVYWRSKEQHGATKDKVGWTCSYCARFEAECICDVESPLPPPLPAPPSRLTINDLALLRQVVLQVIDEGCTCDGDKEQHPWELFEGAIDGMGDEVTEEVANQQRLRFADAIQTGLLRRVAPALVGANKPIDTPR